MLMICWIILKIGLCIKYSAVKYAVVNLDWALCIVEVFVTGNWKRAIRLQEDNQRQSVSSDIVWSVRWRPLLKLLWTEADINICVSNLCNPDLHHRSQLGIGYHT